MQIYINKHTAYISKHNTFCIDFSFCFNSDHLTIIFAIPIYLLRIEIYKDFGKISDKLYNAAKFYRLYRFFAIIIDFFPFYFILIHKKCLGIEFRFLIFKLFISYSTPYYFLQEIWFRLTNK